MMLPFQIAWSSNFETETISIVLKMKNCILLTFVKGKTKKPDKRFSLDV